MAAGAGFLPLAGELQPLAGQDAQDYRGGALIGGDDPLRAGEVVALDRGGFGIGSGDGVLDILRVQLEGKQALSAAEFLRGQRDFIGAVLPSS